MKEEFEDLNDLLISCILYFVIGCSQLVFLCHLLFGTISICGIDLTKMLHWCSKYVAHILLCKSNLQILATNIENNTKKIYQYQFFII
jgi:hypothetical protein